MSMRIGFVTTEYITEYRNGGGLGNYLARICQLLLKYGHDVEVFVKSERDWRGEIDGVLVHRVNAQSWTGWLDFARRFANWLPRGGYATDCSVRLFGPALALASSLRQREREVGFDLVQSADFQAAGLFIRRKRGRVHAVRCSCAADLWSAADGPNGFNNWHCYWERRAIANGDVAYAPSRLVADHYQRKYDIPVQVLRPPMAVETTVATEPVPGLPPRYHVHFGQLNRRKGSDFLARTLPRVWMEEPGFRMVWAGRASADAVADWRRLWGENAEKVVLLGAIEKPQLYQILQRAEASVLPSMVDNLPNTAIESLMFDRPVIGTLASSIDELVVDDVNGKLVTFDDEQGLAAAILKVWNDWTPRQQLMELSPIRDEMQPEAAVNNLLALAHCHRKTTHSAGRVKALN